jgi:SAM-dependent methyltransferase
MSTDRLPLKPVTAAPVPCKICDSPAPLYGVVDFNKCCEEARGFRLPLSGVPIYYRRCPTCGFLFTDAFDDWSEDQFKAHIYNDDYHLVDPDYRTGRPSTNAAAVVQLWGAIKANTRVLDYGGGNGTFCAALRQHGFPLAVTYDPMVPDYAQRPPGKFDLVTCFETLEHLPDPVAGISALVESVAEPGLVFYSTLVQPDNLDDRGGLAWWYAGPRNGHISLFTRQSLMWAWGRRGYKTVTLGGGCLHLAFRTLPYFLAHLQSQADNLLTVTDPVLAPRDAAHAA